MTSARIANTDDYGPRWRGHYVRIKSAADLNEELRAWLQESRDVVGMQSDIAEGRGTAPKNSILSGRSQKRALILATRQISSRQTAGNLPFSPSDCLLRIIAGTGQTRKAGGLGTLHPDNDDVVVRQRRGNPHVVYLLGTPTTPEQFSLRTREEAVTQAVAFAKRQRVRAWFDNGDNTFLLLATFRKTE